MDYSMAVEVRRHLLKRKERVYPIHGYTGQSMKIWTRERYRPEHVFMESNEKRLRCFRRYYWTGVST